MEQLGTCCGSMPSEVAGGLKLGQGELAGKGAPDFVQRGECTRQPFVLQDVLGEGGHALGDQRQQQQCLGQSLMLAQSAWSWRLRILRHCNRNLVPQGALQSTMILRLNTVNFRPACSTVSQKSMTAPASGCDPSGVAR